MLSGDGNNACSRFKKVFGISVKELYANNCGYLNIGGMVHKIESHGYNDPVNHINIEIHVKGSKKYKPKWNYHIILNELGEVTDKFATGIWSK